MNCSYNNLMLIVVVAAAFSGSSSSSTSSSSSFEICNRHRMKRIKKRRQSRAAATRRGTSSCHTIIKQAGVAAENREREGWKEGERGGSSLANIECHHSAGHTSIPLPPPLSPLNCENIYIKNISIRMRHRKKKEK